MKKHNWLVRASQIGDLMTNDRSGKGLGETAQKKILEAVLFNKYGIEQPEISSKFIEKGNLNEKESIKLASKSLGWFDVDPEAPKTRLFNDFVTGEPDILTPFVLGDVKSSWSAHTFPWLADPEKCPNKGYFYQMQTYLWLSGRDVCELVYVLTNTPDHLIYDEVRKAVWKNITNPEYHDKTEAEIEEILEEKIRKQLTYDQIPVNKRVKKFSIKRCEKTIEEIKTRIELARSIYDQLYNQI